MFNRVSKNSNPEVIDKEYEAFLDGLGGSKAGGAGKKLSSQNEYDKLPSIHGGIGGNRLKDDGFKPPLMLTNGSAAPGAASAHMRSLSNPQMAGGAFIVSLSKSQRAFWSHPFAFL